MSRVTRRRLATTATLALLLPAACTRESVRVALEAQQRADEVHAAVAERQHEALCLLLYRDVVQRLEDRGLSLDAAAREALAAAWNERDLVEFWRLQDERARALRLVGVDAQLYGSQSAADLLWKSGQARAARGRAALAGGAGGALATVLGTSTESAAGAATPRNPQTEGSSHER